MNDSVPKSLRVLRPYLDKLVERRAITPDGRDWLICALDPFHDFLHELAGYPDSDGSQSIVERFTDQTVVTHPPTLQDGDSWECLVFNTPGINYRTYDSPNWERRLDVRHNDINNAGSVDIVTTHTRGGSALWPLTIWTQQSGTGDMVPKTPTQALQSWPLATQLYTVQGLQSIPQDLQGKKMRLIGQGFEVHNTTAPLYQSGSVTVGRVPQAVTKDIRLHQEGLGGPIVDMVDFPCFIVNPPPATTDESIRYTDAQTWEAKHGCYAHCTFAGVDNPMRAAEQSAILMRTEGNIAGECLSSQLDLQKGTAGGLSVLGASQNYCGTNMHYAYFTGLHKETTLNVMNRAYTEHIPRVDDALLPLARPSAALDVHALQLYAEVVNHLPAAVMVEMNSRGRFAKMIGGLLEIAAPVLGIVGSPLAGVSAAAAGAAFELVGEEREEAAVRRARQRASMPAKQTQRKTGPKSVVVAPRKK